MVHLTIKIILVGLLVATISSCYYDNEEELYPGEVQCDTTNVSYSNDIAPILQANCNACHGGAAPQAGIKTDNFTDLMIVVNDGRFQGAVNHEAGFSPMPQNGPKLNDCDLAKINQWISAGAPNN